MKHTPGSCLWNGSEIVRIAEPKKGIAGLAHNAPEEWGYLFAAAPDLYEAARAALMALDPHAANNKKLAQVYMQLYKAVMAAKGREDDI